MIMNSKHPVEVVILILRAERPRISKYYLIGTLFLWEALKKRASSVLLYIHVVSARAVHVNTAFFLRLSKKNNNCGVWLR